MSVEQSAKKLKQTFLQFTQPIVTKKQTCVTLPTPLC